MSTLIVCYPADFKIQKRGRELADRVRALSVQEIGPVETDA